MKKFKVTLIRQEREDPEAIGSKGNLCRSLRLPTGKVIELNSVDQIFCKTVGQMQKNKLAP
ncbi:hypothetical protein OO006_07070 [Prosthecochloris sp. SCSIO W1101]|uniref:hypothetical protein n=1 Tax=Prosthecochloris sp. SCSIO W1101 TaxID=2992242 RepID=UPI00223DC9BF|nr:hypothetical protein [Prosthecochloris sp. SCSIO W1101]UZJ42700.1 hypothetical protein OO006_07070 [Prosthecochloris sp. SCSIO W1101]